MKKNHDLLQLATNNQRQHLVTWQGSMPHGSIPGYNLSESGAPNDDLNGIKNCGGEFLNAGKTQDSNRIEAAGFGGSIGSHRLREAYQPH